MSLLKTASMIVVLTLVGRLLGFFRTIYLSNIYGTNGVTDAFNTAAQIPLTLYLIVPGAINAVLIPTMRGMLEKNEQTGPLYQRMFTIVLVIFTIIAALGIVFARPIAMLLGAKDEVVAFGPGELGNVLDLTTEMLRLMWPSVVFIGLAGLWSSVSNANQHFFTPTLSTVANGAVVIVSMYLLVPVYGSTGLAIATTLGYLAAIVPMMFTMKQFDYQHRLAFHWREDQALREMGERVVPILIGAVVAQATSLLEKSFANGLGEGKVTALANANQLVQMPMAIFVGAFTLPLFPLLASFVKRGEMDRMKETLQKGLSYLLILLLPVTVGFIVYAEPIIRLVFERGAFDEHSVMLTAWALPFYGLALYGLAARDLITRAFYALENTRTPVIVGAFGVIVYAAANLLLIPVFDHGGIALGAAISAGSQALLLFILLWRNVGSLIQRSFLLTTAKTLLGCAVMAAALIVVDPWLSALPLWLYVLVGVGGAAIVYFAVLAVFKEQLVSELLVRVLKRRSTPADSSP
ncbi:murein biosynthesis integral membrane protein MurJ [Brevibacillus ruminantium]|uniref:Probable lipid II flippase MurJ n=1 Tax=Brevibacillus ruminantium TaxID=2950604 RepID=A0ABY4WAR4_9BACL|nr:murein biosynthesis integral membrane protein MurJ [Brevibacillus ruminantium]USG64258.1 murein biosynthesis integral membrane protein MurJ [Brevibacillus ruminantium]